MIQTEIRAPLVRLERIGLHHPGTAEPVLQGVDLDVRDGEILSIVGPSGCGKSTLLRLVAGLIQPTAGALSWRDGERPPLGFVFQEPALMPWLTVAENVAGPLRLGKTPVAATDARERVAEALEWVKLEKYSAMRPRELSGGMKMRVSIARALSSRSRLLLMDEPFAALDEFTREQLNDDMVRIRDERKLTILFVTHSLREAVYISDRVAVLAGRPSHLIHEEALVRPDPVRDRAPEPPTMIASYRRLRDQLSTART